MMENKVFVESVESIEVGKHEYQKMVKEDGVDVIYLEIYYSPHIRGVVKIYPRDYPGFDGDRIEKIEICRYHKKYDIREVITRINGAKHVMLKKSPIFFKLKYWARKYLNL